MDLWFFRAWIPRDSNSYCLFLLALSDSFFFGREKQILCLSQIPAERNSTLWEKTSYFKLQKF